MESNTISDDIQRMHVRISMHDIQIHELIVFLEKTQFIVIEELIKWKHHQRLAMYGDRTIVVNGHLVPCKNVDDLQNDQQLQIEQLNQIEAWHNGLAQIISETLENIYVLCHGNEIQISINKISRILCTLIETSLIILKQPPQVIKKSTK